MVGGSIIQYARNISQDLRKLGRYCLYVFWANPMHKCRIVVGYNIYYGKPKGLKTQYQQIKKYSQHRDIKITPKEPFRRDFTKHGGQWSKAGELLLIVMDVNEHVIDGPLRSMLEDEGV